MSTNKPSFFQNPKSLGVLIIIVAIILILIITVPLLLIRNSNSVQNANSPTSTGGIQSFQVGTDAVLSINEQGGNISVYPSNTNTFTVEPRNPGTTIISSPNVVHILSTQTHDTQGHEHLAITTDPWSRNTDFFVMIPVTASIQITVESGSLDIHGGSGLTASTGSGTIALENIKGPINVSTDSGDVTANNTNGPLKIEAQSGSIRLQQVYGQIDATTFSGDVIAQNSQLSGQSILQTQNGSVRFLGSLNPNGSYKMETTSGDVDLTLPNNAAFSLNASTGSGSIQNAFGEDVVGSTPRAPLLLHTQNGSIAIVQAS